MLSTPRWVAVELDITVWRADDGRGVRSEKAREARAVIDKYIAIFRFILALLHDDEMKIGCDAICFDEILGTFLFNVSSVSWLIEVEMSVLSLVRQISGVRFVKK